MTEAIAWRPDSARASSTRTGAFMAQHDIASYPELVEMSTRDPAWFWGSVVEFLGVPFTRPYNEVVDVASGPQWATWFRGGELNLSEACVDRWARENPTGQAVISEREDGSCSVVDYGELLDQVSRFSGALVGMGVHPDDAVAVYLPMSSHAVIAMLAIARIGAIFIPIFSGFGAEAVATRMAEPRPKVLICADGYTRRGRVVEMKEVADSAIELSGGDVANVIVVEYARRTDTPWTDGRDVRWSEAMSAEPILALPVSAEHPLMIAYTSGTTGPPKGAVHVHGGFTVKIAQEGAFQLDVHRGDRLMWASDMGWIMGPWAVIAALANGAAIVTFDGAPDYPGPDRLWELVERHRITHLGVSPTLIRALQPHGVGRARHHDLSSLEVFGSTGEPWNPDSWWWLFRDIGGERVPIVNISGGTEIGACILSVNLLQGIKPISLGGPALGMAADVFDADGYPLRGSVGELVIRKPWPSMTRGFWKEPQRYLAAYWQKFPEVWVHGDWASIDDDGFWYLHGRSDDTLNIAGKRVGPAEIESAVVALDEIVMAAAIAIPDPIKGESVAVFAVPAGEVEDDEALTGRISEAVMASLGKAFRPSSIRLVPDLPRTRSAKIMRRVVRSVVLGQGTGDTSSLENPESLLGLTGPDPKG